jgi:hypothetical protein
MGVGDRFINVFIYQYGINEKASVVNRVKKDCVVLIDDDL